MPRRSAMLFPQANDIADMRKHPSANTTSIDYAARLWRFFRTLLSRAPSEMKKLPGDIVTWGDGGD